MGLQNWQVDQVFCFHKCSGKLDVRDVGTEISYCNVDQIRVSLDIVGLDTFFIGNSLMFLFGAVSSIYAGGNDIFEVMLNLNLFYLAVLVLGLNIWTTNDNALYTAGLGLSNIFGLSTATGFSIEEFDSAFKLYNRTSVRPVQRMIADTYDKIYGAKGVLTIIPFSLETCLQSWLCQKLC